MEDIHKILEYPRQLKKAGTTDSMKGYDDENGYVDDSGEVIYRWSRSSEWGEEGCFSIYIWADEYYKRTGYVSDMGTETIVCKQVGDEWYSIYDGAWAKGHGREIAYLGYDESCESSWTGQSYGDKDDMQALIDYLENNPHFKHCPELE